MNESSVQDISGLLYAWHNGDDEALQKLIPLVHQQLKQIAHRYMQRERIDHILQTTALLDEAFMRLTNAKKIDWHHRSHFFAISARLMRQILVDFARKRPRDELISLTDKLFAPSDPDLVALDDALTDLAKFDPQKARVVELRFFVGLSINQTAKLLKVSPDKIKRDWRLARNWLFCELRDRVRHGP